MFFNHMLKIKQKRSVTLEFAPPGKSLAYASFPCVPTVVIKSKIRCIFNYIYAVLLTVLP